MTKERERQIFQAIVGLACLVPVAGGLMGALGGAWLAAPGAGINLDSHFRYLSGLLLGIGLGFLTAIPGIERNGVRVSLLAAIVIAGGFARLYGVLTVGWPDPVMIFALGMELAVTPLLWLWQRRIAKTWGSAQAEGPATSS